MASSLNVTTCPANSRAFTSNNDNRGLLSKSLAVELAALNTSTDDCCAALVAAGSIILLDELSLPETMGVDDQRSVSGRAAHEIVAGQTCQ